MTKLLMISLLTVLSCTSCKYADVKIYCSTISNVAPYEWCWFSWEFYKCRCYMYDPLTMEHTSEEYDKHVSYCDNVGGPKFGVWTSKIKPWEKERRRAYDDVCR